MREQLNRSQANVDVKSFLNSVIDKADKLYDEGASSWFHERRVSKTTEARDVLTSVSRFIENQNLSIERVRSAQDARIGALDNMTFKAFVNPPAPCFQFGRLFSAGVENQIGVAHLVSPNAAVERASQLDW